MIAITWPEVLACLALVAAIGGGGFTLGCMIGTDRAEQHQADELEQHIARRAARRTPLAAQTYRPGLAALAAEPDTMPLRAIPAYVAAIGHAAAGLFGLGPHTSDGGLEAATSPVSLELAVAAETHRTELEIADLIRHAEQAYGALLNQETTP